VSAATSALAVLRWALAACTGAGEAWVERGSPAPTPAGPPPRGDFLAPDELLRPPVELSEALADLGAVAAARLRLGDPPLGDGAPPGLDSLVVALSIATASAPPIAAILLASVPASGRAWEWVLRHALVAPALPHLDAELAEGLRAASPLTALFERPPAEGEGMALAACERLLAHRAGRLALGLQLAAPTPDDAVRTWRGRLLARLRHDPATRPFVLDVYEAALIHHRDGHLDAVRAAQAALIAGDRVDAALATSDWWGPLWALERADVAALRARPYLGYDYREGLRLHGLARRYRGL
jgi:hypothetical protein